MNSRLTDVDPLLRVGVRLMALWLTLLLWACGAANVDVVLPSEAQTISGSSARCRGVVAGKVSALSAGSPRTATVTLESSEVAEIVMRDGVKAYVLDSGDIEFDVTRVTDASTRLPSGITLVATRRNALEAAIDRWATGWNVIVVVTGLVSILLILLIARNFARGVASIARLFVAFALASAVAYMATPSIAPLVEKHLYPMLDSGRSRPAHDSQSSQPASTADASADSGDSDASADQRDVRRQAESASGQLGLWARQAADTLRSRPLPDPVYPTFFALWLASFVTASAILVAMTRSR